MTKSDDKIIEARAIFDSGFNCCQAVFTPFAIEHGIDEETSLNLSSGFAAGLCYSGETCGAVIGAHLVFGLKNGYNQPNDKLSKDKIRGLIENYRNEFIAKNGSTFCKELLGANPATKEGINYLKTNGIFEEKCPGFVVSSVEIIEKLLNENL